MDKPTYDQKKGWTCPKGYAHPKCPGCGHNYFDSMPQKVVGGHSPKGGLCQWCIKDKEAGYDIGI